MANTNFTAGTITYTEQSASSITDLTGTKWLINSAPVLSPLTNNVSDPDLGEYGQYDFEIEGTSYEDFPIQGIGLVGDEYGLTILNIGMVVYDGDWTEGEGFRTIEITGGSDATNADLIAWLEANATQQTVGTTYELTHSLTNLTHGNVSFTVTPDSGYSLPSSVTVSNGTLVSYDSSTGIIVVSGDGAEISVTCEQASVGYNVTFTASGRWADAGDSYGVKIFDGQGTNGTLLVDSIPGDKNDFPQTLEISSGYCTIQVVGSCIMGFDLTSSEYTFTETGSYTWIFIAPINQNGSINIGISTFDD